MNSLAESVPILSCEQVYFLPNSQQCDFVQSQCSDQPGFVNSFTLYYCISQSETARHWLGIPILIFFLVILFSSIGIVAGNCLVPNLNAIANHLNIPENISGLTLLAFANGSPDIISTYTSFITGNTSLAFGEIIGSIYFVNSVIIGIIFILKPFDLVPIDSHAYELDNAHINTINNNKDGDESSLISLNAKGTYLRDVSFFIISTLVLLYCVRDGILTRFEMMILVSIYITYVFTIISWQWYFKKELSKIRLDNRARNLYVRNPLPLVVDENVEFEDSYDFNPQILHNLEFATILNGITSRHRQELRITLSNTQQYRDNTSENIEMGQLQAEIIEPPKKTIIQNIFDCITLPLVKLFSHTIPILTVSDYEGDYKPALSQLLQLLTSLLLSPFIIFCAFLPDLSFLTLLLICFPFSCFAYFSYYNLVHSSNPLTLVKTLISLLGVIVSISWISIIASQIISILSLVSSLTYIRPSALGITIFALGNSVGDLVSCIVITKMGYPLMALAACIGGPLLNMLLGLGMSGLFVGVDFIEIPASASIIFCLIGLLFNLIVVLLIFIPIGGWRCDKYVGLFMIFLWFVGVSVAIVLEILLTY